MELQKPKITPITKNQILYIKHYHHLVDIGGDSVCYNLTSKQVIKLFDMSYFNPNNKLFLPHEIYGNNTFILIDELKTYCDKIVAYTMAYVKGAQLGKTSSAKLFYELSFEMIENYLTTLLTDCQSLANNGIQVYDSFETNIILSDTGFKHIDSLDFLHRDTDPTIIAKENIKLMCISIWDSLIAPILFKFLEENNFNEHDFHTSPIEILKEMRTTAENQANHQIKNLKDIHRLSRRLNK